MVLIVGVMVAALLYLCIMLTVRRPAKLVAKFNTDLAVWEHPARYIYRVD